MKDHRNRPLVRKFLKHWKMFINQHGPQYTKKCLESGEYTVLTRKDALGIGQHLGLFPVPETSNGEKQTE